MEKLMKNSQFNEYFDEIYKDEYKKFLIEKWENLTKNEKLLVIECCKQMYPKYNNRLLKESSWYNWIGDIIGFFDPTGIVNVINGLDYLRQGDTLLGLISIACGIPVIGKIVGIPLLIAIKSSVKIMNLFKGNLDVSSVTKLANSVPLFGKFMMQVPKMSKWFIGVAAAVPGLALLKNAVDSHFGDNGILTQSYNQLNMSGSNSKKETTNYDIKQKPNKSGDDIVSSFLGIFK